MQENSGNRVTAGAVRLSRGNKKDDELVVGSRLLFFAYRVKVN